MQPKMRGGMSDGTTHDTSSSVLQEPCPNHTAIEDAYGLFIGILFSAMGIALLAHGGMITGGVAGMALLGSFVSGHDPALLVPLINIPFILFSVYGMGRAFGCKSALVSVAIGVAVNVIDQSLRLPALDNAFAAVVGGTFLGMGVLCLARHHASMGGTSALTLWIQRRHMINAGKCQLVFDLILFTIAWAYLPWEKILWSALGTVAMNAMLIAWHKPGRYRG